MMIFDLILKLADKLKLKDQKDKKYVSSIPIQITNNDFQNSQNENTLYPISRCLMDIKLPNNIFYKTYSLEKTMLTPKFALHLSEMQLMRQ
jgi:hypothetical protein